MKANEAPEKIYIVNDDLNIKREWYKTKQVGFDTTEYIRTNVFIEKACEYLQINLWRVVNEEPDFRQRFVTNFRKYMGGE